MINLGNLFIEGFCSIQSLELNLSNNRVTIIRGPNGVGKSTILMAIAWVLYGELLKEDVKEVNTWPNKRPKGYNGTKVSLFFSVNNTIHNVIRCSSYKEKVDGSKGGDRLIYTIDNQPINEKGKRDIQALITKNLGMSFELFKNSIMFGQGLRRLAQESGSDKKDLFEDLFDLYYITKANKIAKDRISKLSSELSEMEWETKSIKKSISECESKIEHSKTIMDDFNNRKKARLNAIDEKIQATKKKLGTLKFDPLGLAKAYEQKDSLREELSKLQEVYLKSKKDTDIFNTNESISSFIDELQSLAKSGKLTSLISKLEKLRSSLKVILSYNKSRGKLMDKLDEVNTTITKLESVKSIADVTKRSLKEQLETKQSIEDEPKPKLMTHKVKSEMSSLLNKLELKEKEMAPLDKEISDLRWIISDPLSNKGLKPYIIESSLSNLNEILEKYATAIGMRIEIGIDLDSTKKDFYVIIAMGKDIVRYQELSGGQKQLVNIAIAFSMHEIVTSSKDINILFLDEVFENLDYENVELVVSMIRKMVSQGGKSLYVISHQPNLPINNASVINLSSQDGLTIFNQ